jgi:hypothetical protein
VLTLFTLKRSFASDGIVHEAKYHSMQIIVIYYNVLILLNIQLVGRLVHVDNGKEFHSLAGNWNASTRGARHALDR